MAYALLMLTKYSVWIAMLVFAYGGATIDGLVAQVQLVPAALSWTAKMNPMLR